MGLSAAGTTGTKATDGREARELAIENGSCFRKTFSIVTAVCAELLRANARRFNDLLLKSFGSICDIGKDANSTRNDLYYTTRWLNHSRKIFFVNRKNR
jgi:hypothetical protein